MPQNFIVANILSEAQKIAGFPRLEVVDLSCGEGELLRCLQAQGCRVQGTRFCAGDYIIKKDQLAVTPVRIQDNVNLCQPLPFPAAAFDLVLLTEVIEHLGDYAPVIHEAGRILRPGGRLLLSTPNIFRVHSRLQFLLAGTHKVIAGRVGWDTPKEQLYSHHISPVDLPYLHTLLFQAGLRISALRFTRVKWRHAPVFLLAPLLLLGAGINFSPWRRPGLRAEGERDLRRWMNHPATLFSEQLFLVITKTGGGGKEA